MKTNCAALYNHVNLRAGNELYPCCRFKKSLGKWTEDISDALHSPVFEHLRYRAQTEELPECAKCFHEERIGRKSYRQWWNENYDTSSVSLKYLLIGLDNICNLSCDGCGPEWSSSWFKKLNPDQSVKVGYKITEIDSIPETVEFIEFQGGEPLQTSRWRDTLALHPNPNNCTVQIVTNCMHELSLQDHAVLAKFQNVKFWLSIDGFGSTNDRVRTGSQWETVEKNALDIQSWYEAKVETTMHCNNVFDLPQLETWISGTNLDWNIFPLTRPPHLDCADMEDKDRVIDVLNSLQYEGKDRLIDHCTSKTQPWLV